MNGHGPHINLAGAIDAHQHFWQYDPVQHSGINDEMARIGKDFLQED